MFALFDDLEQQAAGLHLVERDAEVADLTQAEYARISLGARLHASLGLELRVRLVGGHVVAGRLARVGEDWLLLVDRRSEWIVRYAGIVSLAGLSPRANSEETWSVVDRLSLRAVLRRRRRQRRDRASCTRRRPAGRGPGRPRRPRLLRAPRGSRARTGRSRCVPVARRRRAAGARRTT